MRAAIGLVLFVALLTPATGFSADAEVAPSKSKSAGPKHEALEKLFAEWKILLTETTNLQQKYISANRAQREEIKSRYDELIEQGDVMHRRLVKAAKEAYVEAPEADPTVEQFLGFLAWDAFRTDDYENALELVKLLLENGSKEKQLYLWGGISAFCVGDLDLAKDYLNTAVKKGLDLKSGKKNPLDMMVMLFQQDPRRFRKAWEEEQKIRAQEAEADDLPRVLIKTNKGDIVVELFENEAPNTVANFLSLVSKGFYNGLTFHRVLPGFMAQGGCPRGDGKGGPGYMIKCECTRPDHRNHFRGSLSMAHAGPNTGGSQFFLTFIPTSKLDGVHTVFGRVIKGMDVLGKIRKRDPSDAKETLAAPDEIIEARVLRKRPHQYKVEKIESHGK